MVTANHTSSSENNSRGDRAPLPQNFRFKLFWSGYKTVVFITHSISEAVFLSNRVVVMSPRPGKVAEILPIELGGQRHFELRDEPEFAHFTRRIRRLFEKMGVFTEHRRE